ncbi:terpene cyclase [Streptomyces sp. NPDC058289]|uniref:terpene synthase family protein n=1 Tax=Streptomyces sp. NPDC058289 TaxID=3346425 RepID=UPI0036E17E2E
MVKGQELGQSEIPWAWSVSPDLARAAPRHLAWMRETGLIVDAAPAPGQYQSDRYVRCDVARLTAMGWPMATGVDLDLVSDWMGWILVFDDMFDGPLGRDPARCRTVVERMISILHRGADPATEPLSPVERGFADLWERSTAGMSVQWRARAAQNYESYFISYVHEAVGRERGRIPGLEEFLLIRRSSVALDIVFDLLERVAGFEVPLVALRSPELRTARQLGADLPWLTNDFASLEKEEASGDNCNLFIVLRHEFGHSDADALDSRNDMLERWVRRFDQIEAGIGDLCARLRLTAQEAAAVDSYLEGIRLYVAGYCQWERGAWRYSTDFARTQHGPGAAPQAIPEAEALGQAGLR